LLRYLSAGARICLSLVKEVARIHAKQERENKDYDPPGTATDR
jgi:hypothetical protein